MKGILEKNIMIIRFLKDQFIYLYKKISNSYYSSNKSIISDKFI
jgi:hypothetical protein